MAKRTNVRRQIGIPPASADDATSYNQSLQTLYAGYRDTLGANATSASQFRAAFRTTKASLMAQERQGLSDAEGNAIDRGVLGSTGDYKARTDVRAQVAAALAQAANTRDQGLLGLDQQNMSAYRQLQMGTIAAQQGLANAQAAEAAQNLLYGNGGPGAKAALQPDQQAKLAASRSSVTDALQQYVQAYNGDLPRGQGVAYEALVQAWRDRNRVRKSLGLDPLPTQLLGAMVQKALSDINPPVGRPGRGPR